MSNINKKRQAIKQSNERKRQGIRKQQEEFGAEPDFDAEHLKKDDKLAAREKLESERTPWN